MLSAGVLGRIFPHPSTVQRMLVRTSLVSSVMEGLIISLSCKGSFSLHFCLLWRLSLLTVEAAMIQHSTTRHIHFQDTSHSNQLTTDSPRTFTSGCRTRPHATQRRAVHYLYFLYKLSIRLQTNALRLHFRVLFAPSQKFWIGTIVGHSTECVTFACCNSSKINFLFYLFIIFFNIESNTTNI